MGNSIGCSASGERLVSAARDGDFVEAKMLLDCNQKRVKYSTFGGLNSPLHFAAAKGHDEIVTLLLENGAAVNSRNYSGQTALMQACRYGHWEVVQTLILFRCNVTRADYLNGRTALHFATVNGHVRCIRLLTADLFPCAPFGSPKSPTVGDKSDCPNYKTDPLFKLVNKAADGGLTALHMAALNGYFDCVHLLLDLHANVSSTTFNSGSSMDFIGAGSTPLHYAACGGNLKCCQILLARGASRLSLNCNGWLPSDVARKWNHHEVEALLKPNSDLLVPTFPPSNYLALPLLSMLNIARDCGLKLSATATATDDADTCAVCLERACGVAAEGCAHEFCVRCALYLCSSSNNHSETSTQPGSIPCPLCRQGITYFVKLPNSSSKDARLPLHIGRCTPDMTRQSLDLGSSEFFGPATCGQLVCDDEHCLNSGLEECGPREEAPRRRSISCRREKMGWMGLEKRWNVLKGRRSCSREINA